ncbi:hypothetical protein QQS21_005783 [Conoideocrella luteorostrata]|uniref:DUF8004 domain-containing protein n=1 Tax=Conoideocrella luteorostrata TaxID=1105319 RepID=A0AAJ0FYU0_9HYPO|nr:hypothetical protein QQS21_005783 [Conoideocrella luteorostrata]
MSLLQSSRTAVSKPSSRLSRRTYGSSTYLDATSSLVTSTSNLSLKKWDGAKRICTSWGNLEKDPELSMRNGNCLVYLHDYNDDQKRRHPERTVAFKLPFSLLLATKCCALIERCQVNFSTDVGSRPPRGPSEIQKWCRSNPKQTVELFIPAPQNANERQIRRHQLLMRNFFAWVLRRSLVGETLGDALVGLLECMHEFRSGEAIDNVADLSHFLDEEGYLCLAGQPDHALAILRLAETFHLKDLYLQALTHCVGMSDMLPRKLEFQHVSLATRNLIHESEDALTSRLKKTSDMLDNFLDEELSEAYMGISDGIRAHLERFRSFLLSYYSTKLGYYPPRLFDGPVCRSMALDFEALYNLLVDEGYSSAEAMPSVAAGGMCTLQLVQSFDSRNDFEPMKHPMPKLPHQDQEARSRRLSWLPRSAKQRADERQLGHVALVNASNWNGNVFQNSLVKAYRKFEEECAISARKADRNERTSLVDGRKVRWILIYAVHQTLRNATQRPPSVQDDSKASYVVSIARDTGVPWQDNKCPRPLQRSRTEPVLSRLIERPELDHPRPTIGKLEIKPDIDYFALTHKESASPSVHPRRASLPALDSQTVLPRTDSFREALSRSANIRRSLRKLKHGAPNPAPLAVSTAKPQYHEIVVHGYGNGTNDVHMKSNVVTASGRPSLLANRSGSTVSETGSSNISIVPSLASMVDTVDSSLNSPILPESPLEMSMKGRGGSHLDSSAVVYCPSPTDSSARKSNSFKRRSMGSAMDGYNYATKAFGQFVDQERRGVFASGRHGSLDLKRTGSVSQSRSMTFPIREDDIHEEPYILTNDSGDWTAMQAFLDGKVPDKVRGGSMDAYADLGGLTEAG